jgi:hypothetical protein
MEGLGRLFDIGLCLTPVDSQTGANTGKRISMKNATGCTILVNKAAGTANDDPVFTLKQHTAASGGTSANLATIDHYYLKDEAVLDNDESWVKYTQTASQTLTDPGGAGTSAEHQQLLVIEVSASSLSDGYAWISLDLADTGSAGAQLVSAIYILHDLAVQRTPANLGNLLNPGAANA